MAELNVYSKEQTDDLIQQLVDLDTGPSAFDIAVSEGFVGTESEWLASLQGEDGADAIPVSGDSSSRPATPAVGTEYFDTTLGHPIWWSGTAWVDATGATAGGA